MAFDYESAKAQFGAGRAREMEAAQADSGVSSQQAAPRADAPQASSAPQQGDSGAAQKEGKGGPGWNEDFDQAWANRVLGDQGLKDMFGLSDYASLRDPETRRIINKRLRAKREESSSSASATTGGAVAGSPAAPASDKAAGAASAQPAGTTGKTVGQGTTGAPPAPSPGRSVLLQTGILPPIGWQYPNLQLPTVGGVVQAQPNLWWPQPTNVTPAVGGATSAAVQASALEKG